jgi:hypothetical protein
MSSQTPIGADWSCDHSIGGLAPRVAWSAMVRVKLPGSMISLCALTSPNRAA